MRPVCNRALNIKHFQNLLSHGCNTLHQRKIQMELTHLQPKFSSKLLTPRKHTKDAMLEQATVNERFTSNTRRINHICVYVLFQ
jgi:hypothetical protein